MNSEARSKTLLAIARKIFRPRALLLLIDGVAIMSWIFLRFKPFRINPSKLFADRYSHSNGIENVGISPSITG